jgi:hypothetical protein
MRLQDSGLTEEELAILRPLSSPIKIQDFLDSLPINFEKHRETYYSPRKVLRLGKAHCFEGALLAATALWLIGEKPLLLDLKSTSADTDHVVTLYRRNGYWGAISKTNHATLRFRDPIYKNVRELAASYFHEYFLGSTGIKTLVSYSGAFSLIPFGTSWITSEEDLDHIAEALDAVPHNRLYPQENNKFIRIADPMEREAGSLTEWKRSDKGT